MHVSEAEDAKANGSREVAFAGQTAVAVRRKPLDCGHAISAIRPTAGAVLPVAAHVAGPRVRARRACGAVANRVGRRLGPGSLNGLASRRRCGFAKGAAALHPWSGGTRSVACGPPGGTRSVASGGAKTVGGNHGHDGAWPSMWERGAASVVWREALRRVRARRKH
jgi:hypothetical protein